MRPSEHFLQLLGNDLFLLADLDWPPLAGVVQVRLAGRLLDVAAESEGATPDRVRRFDLLLFDSGLGLCDLLRGLLGRRRPLDLRMLRTILGLRHVRVEQRCEHREYEHCNELLHD